MLCDRCDCIFQGRCHWRWRRDGLVLERYQVLANEDIWTLERLSTSACSLGHRLWHEINNTQDKPDLSTLVWISRRISFLRGINEEIRPVSVTARRKSTGMMLGETFVWLRGMDCLPQRGPNLAKDLETAQISPEPSSNSSNTFDLASRWLQDCVKSHPECNFFAGKSRLPTRLLKIGEPHDQRIRLCDTANLNTRPLYTTLSHCWGNAKFLKLTKETHTELSKGIPLTLLAKTFRDAVMVSQRLGVGYLWIDSLCIFQDSVQDWQNEASTMSEVYKGSYCNIAAAASGDSNGGCFRPRDPRFIQPCRVTTRYTNRPNAQYLLESLNIAFIPHDCEQPLFRRAWVVQELLLAPRVLHFGSEYVFWACRKQRASEIYPEGMPSSVYTLNPVMYEHKTSYDAVCSWNNVVETYSECVLTNPGDKLVAISGVAKELQTLGEPEEYAAGLWRSFILSQMLWTRFKPNKTSTASMQPEKYRAPSWSWASIEGKVSPRHPQHNSQSLGKLIELRIDHLTVDTFGEVTGGFIRIAGHLRALSFKEFIRKSPYYSTITHPILHGLGKSHSLWTRGIYRLKVYMDGIGTDLEVRDRPHFLPLFKREFIYVNHKAEWATWKGLLLLPTRELKGQFRRCGVLEIWSIFPNPSWLKDASKGHGLSANKLLGKDRKLDDENLEYESFDGSKYTITII